MVRFKNRYLLVELYLDPAAPLAAAADSALSAGALKAALVASLHAAWGLVGDGLIGPSLQGAPFF